MQTTLPKIVALWEELFVPLVWRSRWFMSFRGSELLYYDIEHRRLQVLRDRMGVASADDGSPESKQRAEKFLEKAQRKLEVCPTARGPVKQLDSPLQETAQQAMLLCFPIWGQSCMVQRQQMHDQNFAVAVRPPACSSLHNAFLRRYHPSYYVHAFPCFILLMPVGAETTHFHTQCPSV